MIKGVLACSFHGDASLAVLWLKAEMP